MVALLCLCRELGGWRAFDIACTQKKYLVNSVVERLSARGKANFALETAWQPALQLQKKHVEQPLLSTCTLPDKKAFKFA